MKILAKFTIPLLALLVSCDSTKKDTLIKGSTEHITAVTNAIDDPALVNSEKDSKNWLSYGLNYAEDRFSQLNAITDKNVNDLGLMWTYDLNSIRGVEATPIVVDGIMYVTAPWSIVHAIDQDRKTDLEL